MSQEQREQGKEEVRTGGLLDEIIEASKIKPVDDILADHIHRRFVRNGRSGGVIRHHAIRHVRAKRPLLTARAARTEDSYK